MIRTFARRAYLAITAMFTIFIAVFGYYDAMKAREMILIEKQQTLTKIVVMLDQMLPQSFEEAIVREDVRQMSHREKVALFNKELQPILDQFGYKFPGYGLGYGIEQRVAMYPFKAELLDMPMAPPARRVYETKDIDIGEIHASPMWGGEPVLTVNYPHIYDGQVVAYSWANMKLEDIDDKVTAVWLRNLAVLAAIWLLVLAVLRYIINRLGARLGQLQAELEEENHNLCQSEERFRKTFDNNPCIMMITSEFRYLDVNESFVKASGLARSEVIGKTFWELNLWYDEAEKREFEQLLLSQQCRVYNFPMRYRTREGPRSALYTVDNFVLGDKLCFLGILTDIEDKKQHEENMARFDRLNLVGEMAAGIAHEVRNPLTTVRGYLQFYQRKSDFCKYAEAFATMIEELDRANSIITEFLSLAKNKPVKMHPGNLLQIIQALFPLLQAEAFRLGHRLEAETGDVPDIQLDEKEIRQLILNLTRNALEAMKPGGQVTVSTYADSKGVVLAIKDTGPGIPDEVRSKLGTPFITTKENGTGLGLPVCYRIAQRHHAHIDISTGEQGTTFFVKFPLDD